MNNSLFVVAIISENLEIVTKALDYKIGIQLGSSISYIKFFINIEISNED